VQSYPPRALRGWPAVGLLLLRLALALALASRRPTAHLAELVAAVLLVGGVWTPAVAALVAVVECWRTIAQSGGWISLLLTTMALSLALIGPGSWSLDAKIFGWRRIEIPTSPKRAGDS
jgi:putative oxidoreductase